MKEITNTGLAVLQQHRLGRIGYECYGYLHIPSLTNPLLVRKKSKFIISTMFNSCLNP